MNRWIGIGLSTLALMAFVALPACSTETGEEQTDTVNTDQPSDTVQTSDRESRVVPTGGGTCQSNWDCGKNQYCCVPCGATAGTCSDGCPQVVCP